MKGPSIALTERLIALSAAAFLISTICLAETTPKKKTLHHTLTRAAAARSAAAAKATAAPSTGTPVRVAAKPERSAAAAPKLAATINVAPVAARDLAGAIVPNGPWTEPTFADSTDGDNVDGEDLVVRRAAVEALGDYNGSVVAVDPSNGRILTMVNQRLALGSGFQPCSTIKLSVALAALGEEALKPETKFRLPGLGRMDLTYALAHSNNYFFATLGEALGFQKISYYAHLLGYGEKAGLNVMGEQPGRYPSAPPRNGGMGMLCSFGEDVLQTPLQPAALMSAIANGGTLYYLQYPESPADVQTFIPRIKRRLDIAKLIPVVEPGMRGAVEFGTAQRAKEDGPIAGKTGTCGQENTHLGWFGSFNSIGSRKLVVVVLLTGGRQDTGPLAAGIAGDIYHTLSEKNYFASLQPITHATLVASKVCCSEP